MKNIIFKKLLTDCLIFFTIALFSSGLVIWILQAVNFLDIIIEDGRNYDVYLKFSLLNFPRIISKLIPFIFFFSFFFVLTKYELSNEMIIFWNFGVSKIKVIEVFLIFSLTIMIFQIFLSSLLVPLSQDKARSFLRNSEVNVFESFIKPKKFNDTIKNVTIFSEAKETDGSLKNIYLKKNLSNKNFQITYAKKGELKKINNSPVLILFNGETISSNDDKISSFKFAQSDFNLGNTKTNTTTYTKTQETSTEKLIRCIFYLKKKLVDSNEKIFIENCSNSNLKNIYKEITKRLFSSFYIPLLMMIALLVILKSKETINYLKYRIYIFILGILTIVISELSLRFISLKIYQNLIVSSLPIIVLIFIFFILKYKNKENII
ncbi:LptF/LptG family permease [Candidatus Pelagibacter sp.]|nr:LptF/LptG family permease [Candidatus Pelagibacter sp.]